MDQFTVLGADGREYGPVDLAGLQQWLREGRILGTTLIRRNGGDPVPANTLPELAVIFSPPPPMEVPPHATAVALPAEFRAWEFIEQAWELVKPHWLPMAAMFVVVTGIGAIPYLGAFVMFIVGGAIYVGINRAILGLLAGRTPTVGMMFEGFDRFGQAFLAMLVTGLLIGLGTLLLIVPGIILAIMWMFVSLVLADTNLEFWPAMEYSARLTEGYRWALFGLGLACVAIAILGMLACCVGVFVAQPVIYTAIALAYRFLQSRQAAQTA
jgi:uncharacterized membrane protein